MTLTAEGRRGSQSTKKRVQVTLTEEVVRSQTGDRKVGATRQAGDANSRGGNETGRQRGSRGPRSTPTAESERRRQATKRRGRRGRQVTPTAEGTTRQAGNAKSRVGEAQAGNRKEVARIQSGDRKEWARQLKGGGDEAGRRRT